MSIYAVNYLCREILRDHTFRAAMAKDPAQALAGKDISEPERQALLAGDVGMLFRMGANPFLMAYMARFEVCGLNAEIYNQRMRAEKIDEFGLPLVAAGDRA
jgi:Aromatic-ring-opening dioxygenase LigAB, LigA subunit